MGRTPAPAPEPAPELIGVGEFVEDASHAIPLAGLLTAQPDLAEAELTREDWQVALDSYLTSPRP